MKVCGLVQSTSVSSHAISLYYLNSGTDLSVCATWSRDCLISGATAFNPACQPCAGPPRRGVSHSHLQSLSLVLANRKGLGILCPRGHKGHMSAVVLPLHLFSSQGPRRPLQTGTRRPTHSLVPVPCGGSSDGLSHVLR